LYNLIPACTYCNTSFKRDFYSSFTNCYSPLEPNIDKAFQFEIVAREKADNSFREIMKMDNLLYTKDEKYYLSLIGLNDITTIKTNLDTLVLELKSINPKAAKNATELVKGLVQNLRKLLTDWKNSFYDYYLNVISSSYTSQITCLTIINKYQDLKNDYIELLKNTTESTHVTKSLKKAITCIRDILAIILSNNFYEFELVDNEDFNFVDVHLGKSSNYVIKIAPNSHLSNKMKQKVLHNVSLFQLETLYEQFKPFINQKIDQSYYINKLYTSQLVESFPTWLDKEYVDGFADSLFYLENDYHHNILGKLTYDLIKPSVQKEENDLHPLVY